jgi:hypothetical protein
VRTLNPTWFGLHFMLAVSRNNFIYKAFMVLDNTAWHSHTLENLYPAIYVVFMPLNTSCNVQRMDEAFITDSK